MRQETVDPADREELLVDSHRSRRDLFGQLQELRIERASNESGPLHEVCEDSGEIRVGIDPAADLGREPPGRLEDRGASSIAVRLHVGAPELLEVILGAGHGERTVGEDAVPDGRIPGADAEELERDDPAAEERLPAASPPHGFGKSEAFHDPWDDFRENVARRPARHGPPDGHRTAAGGVDDDQGGDVRILRPREPVGGARRLPVGVEGDGSGRSEHLVFAVGLAFGDALRPDDEPARRRERLHRLGGEIRLRESVGDPPRKLLPRSGERRRGNLFRQDLEKEVVAFHESGSVAPRGKRRIRRPPPARAR